MDIFIECASIFGRCLKILKDFKQIRLSNLDLTLAAICKIRFIYCKLSLEYVKIKLNSQSIPTETSQDSIQNISSISTEDEESKVIPRLVNTSVPLDLLNTVDPENWSTADVTKFLKVNDCQPYCGYFENITGQTMLQLTKDEIIELLEKKVGPSVKIFDLIQQLKCKIKQPQCRFK